MFGWKGGGGGDKGVQLYVRHFWGRIPKPWDWKKFKFDKYPFLRLEKLQFEATFVVKIPRERAKEVFKPGPLSVQPKISEIFLRNQQMERTISVRSDRNIWEHLWRWSTLTGLVISVGQTNMSLCTWQNCCPQYRSFVSYLQEQWPNAWWLGSGLCNRNVPFHSLRGMWNFQNCKLKFLLMESIPALSRPTLLKARGANEQPLSMLHRPPPLFS